jgi:hypothetical protein
MRGKHLTASLPKPSIIQLRLALSACHLATQFSRESFRLVQRARRARLALQGLAGRPLSSLHTYYATAPQTVERPRGSVIKVALKMSATIIRVANLSSVLTKGSPEIF